jgi:pre-60S factor REI1
LKRKELVDFRIIIELLSSSVSEASEESNYLCEACGKTFTHNSQYRQHLKSKKHSKNSSKKEVVGKSSSEKKNYVEGKPKTTLDSVAICLFCSAVSESLDKNLEHMSEKHSFILPYSEVLKDREAVIKYLAEKIHIGNICIGCNNYKTGSFKSSQAIQQHMQDKGHTYLELNIFQDEYATFVKHKHQFLKKRQPITGRISAVMTLKEIEEMKNERAFEEPEVKVEEKDKSKSSSSFSCVSAGDAQDVISVNSFAQHAGGAEDEWEDIQLNDVKKSDDQSKSGLRKSTSLSASDLSDTLEVTIADEHILLDTGELLLSNGKLIGHRMYNYIYKQRLPSHETKQPEIIVQRRLEALKAIQKEMKGKVPRFNI